jgi:hypothetical protein
MSNEMFLGGEFNDVLGRIVSAHTLRRAVMPFTITFKSSALSTVN